MEKESWEQAAFVQWLRRKGISFFSVPNGFIAGGRNKWGVLAKMKREGMTNGAPDLVIIPRSPRLGSHVVVEMKRVRGGKLSDAQVEIIKQMRDCGWVVIVAAGCGNAITEMEAQGF